MKEKKAKSKAKVVEEANGYERTYEGFFDWVRDTGRDVPMYALREYCELEKLRTKACSNSIREAIAQAQRLFRVKVFEDIKEFLEDGYKVKVARAPSGMHSLFSQMLRRHCEGDRIQSSTTGKSLPKGSPRRESLSKVHIPTCDELSSLRKGDSK